MSENGGNGNRTFVIGVGMTKFEKPETKEWDYPQMAKDYAQRAGEEKAKRQDAKPPRRLGGPNRSAGPASQK